MVEEVWDCGGVGGRVTTRAVRGGKDWRLVQVGGEVVWDDGRRGWVLWGCSHGWEWQGLKLKS